MYLFPAITGKAADYKMIFLLVQAFRQITQSNHMDSSFRSKDVALAPTPSLCTNQLNSRRGRRSHNNNLIILREPAPLLRHSAQAQRSRRIHSTAANPWPLRRSLPCAQSQGARLVVVRRRKMIFAGGLDGTHAIALTNHPVSTPAHPHLPYSHGSPTPVIRKALRRCPLARS